MQYDVTSLERLGLFGAPAEQVLINTCYQVDGWILFDPTREIFVLQQHDKE